MDERAKNNTLQTRNGSWVNSIFKKIEIKFDLQPIHKPQKQHKKKWQSDNRIRIFEMIVVH